MAANSSGHLLDPAAKLLRSGGSITEIASELGIPVGTASALVYAAEPLVDASLRIEPTPEAVVEARDLARLRWERIAARAGITVALARALYMEGGGDLDRSWTGRGRPPAGTSSLNERGANAARWLGGYLAEQERTADDVKSMSAAAGFAWATIRRAAKEIGVNHRRIGWGRDGKWFWCLPEGWSQKEFEAAREERRDETAVRRAAAPRRKRTAGAGISKPDGVYTCDNCGSETESEEGATLLLSYHNERPQRFARLCDRCAAFLPTRTAQP